MKLLKKFCINWNNNKKCKMKILKIYFARKNDTYLQNTSYTQNKL